MHHFASTWFQQLKSDSLVIRVSIRVPHGSEEAAIATQLEVVGPVDLDIERLGDAT